MMHSDAHHMARVLRLMAPKWRQIYKQSHSDYFYTNNINFIVKNEWTSLSPDLNLTDFRFLYYQNVFYKGCSLKQNCKKKKVNQKQVKEYLCFLLTGHIFISGKEINRPFFSENGKLFMDIQNLIALFKDVLIISQKVIRSHLFPKI